MADAATTDCTVPAGSADTATGTTTTGGESTSTGTSSKDTARRLLEQQLLLDLLDRRLAERHQGGLRQVT